MLKQPAAFIQLQWNSKIIYLQLKRIKHTSSPLIHLTSNRCYFVIAVSEAFLVTFLLVCCFMCEVISLIFWSLYLALYLHFLVLLTLCDLKMFFHCCCFGVNPRRLATTFWKLMGIQIKKKEFFFEDVMSESFPEVVQALFFWNSISKIFLWAQKKFHLSAKIKDVKVKYGSFSAASEQREPYCFEMAFKHRADSAGLSRCLYQLT